MIYLSCGLSALAVVLCILLLVRDSRRARDAEAQARRAAEAQAAALSGALSELRQELSATINGANQLSAQAQGERLADFARRLEALDTRFEAIRTGLDGRMAALQQSNEKQLEEMRKTVDERMQKTLESRIGESFKLVNERLEQVWRGLGEMQNLAVSVGDLKKVLSNVKTRGILGEIQLGAILAEILSPDQYLQNVATVPRSQNPVEFAVKLPGDGDTPVLLPIDSKFPADAYEALLNAYESGDAAAVDAAGKALDARLKGFARDIRDKYISPPHTTDFGIMFLPVEGLYAEVVRRGLVEVLQRDYRVNIAGPTTMAALLNSLQMGFRTLAIQKRSGEISRILGAVKTEFATFEKVLTDAQTQLGRVGNSLDTLIGVRTRQINRKLNSVTELDPLEASQLLEE
ncbi:MAG: DNA recombination protein RmuC [Clostridia bacterium]|nr:DNA recombination protein RmuC [Clostridia bacterium]